jgi:hypothetical protein
MWFGALFRVCFAGRETLLWAKMNGIQSEPSNGSGGKSRFFLFFGVLFLALAVMFHRSFEPYQMLFANDGPLGVMQAENSQTLQTFSGHWVELWWLGMEMPSTAPGISGILGVLLPPTLFMKVFAPLSLAFIGFGAWLLFRQLRFGPMVCLVGGLAAAMNMNYFSVACWGLGSWNLAVGSIFLALAALVSPSLRYPWARAVFAGLAVGMSVMEGFDVGAMLSIFAGLFAVFVAWNGEGTLGGRVGRMVWLPALVVVFAVLIATHSISTLVGTQIQGITGTGQDQTSKDQAWPRATAGSVPKLEMLRVIIPGVFGYRMDAYIHETDKSSAYWGRISESSPTLTVNVGARKVTKTFLELLDSDDPELRGAAGKAVGMNEAGVQALMSRKPLERYQAVAFIKSKMPMGLRHSGGGKYVGIFVTILALFALGNSFRRSGSPFSVAERRSVWFWGGAALVALLLALGRYGFLYRLFFELPYMSSIRNPEKFLMVFNIAWIILAGYALEILRRGCLDVVARPASLANAGRAFGDFMRTWKWVSIVLLGGAVLFPLLFLPGQEEMGLRLWAKGFQREAATGMVLFLYEELAWFAVLLGLGLGLIWLVMKGVFAGNGAKWAWVFAGTLMFVDLAHSDFRWPEYYDVRERYMTDPVLDLLADKPWEHRVTSQAVHFAENVGIGQDARAFGLYFFQLQNQMPARNIQSLDVSQMPRVPELDKAYADAFLPRGNDFTPCFRMWQLTNTRYVLAPANDPVVHFLPEYGFVPKLRLDVGLKPGVTQYVSVGEDCTFVEATNGAFGLFELTNALPRVKLFSNWQVASTNDRETLATLLAPSFDPHQLVLVSKETPIPAGVSDPGADPGVATISSYKSKRVVIDADVKSASVLLLNDRFSPQWRVWVDGKPSSVLQCNYIMRGVYLEKGKHTVEFRFVAKITTLYVSLAAWGVGILLAGFLVATGRKEPSEGAQGEVKSPDVVKPGSKVSNVGRKK